MQELQNIQLAIEAVIWTALMCGLPLVIGLWFLVTLLGWRRGK